MALESRDHTSAAGLKHYGLTCALEAMDLCKIRVKGSIPFRSTILTILSANLLLHNNIADNAG